MVGLDACEKLLCGLIWREFCDSAVDKACFNFDISSKENVGLKIVSNVKKLTEELGIRPFFFLVWKVVLQDLIQAEGLGLADAQSFPTSRLFNNV